MPSLKTLLALLLLSISISTAARASNLSQKLLTMPIKLTSGEVVTLQQFQGKKPVYLKFWATWCQPCRKQMPHFEHVFQQYGDKMAVIAINLDMNDDLAAVLKTQQEFKLTMPMAIDSSGDLAQAFRLLGTPYHLLFDKDMNLIHLGHEADAVLDNKIALLSKHNVLEDLDQALPTTSDNSATLALNEPGPHALFFTATWCNWYLKDSRPAMSQQCILAQNSVSSLAGKFPNFAWQGVVSRLWTGQPELEAYRKKFQIKHALAIDSSNQLFHQYQIKNVPTLIVLDKGKIVLRTSDFSDSNSLAKQLLALGV